MVVAAICFASCATLTERRAPQRHLMLAERRAPQWYLMLPPAAPWGNKFPLVEWQMADSFSSSAECEAYRKGCCQAAVDEWIKRKSVTEKYFAKYFALRYKQGICVAANDPRLIPITCAADSPGCSGVQPLWGSGIGQK